MALTLAEWRERARVELRRLKSAVKPGAPYAVYGAVTALALWPAVQAASAPGANPATVAVALVGILAQAGLNVATSPLVNWLNDRVAATTHLDEAQVAEWAAEAATVSALRADLDTLLEKLDALPSVAQGLSAADRRWFSDTLRDELGHLGNLPRHAQTLNVLVQGDYVAGDHYGLSGSFSGMVNVNPTFVSSRPWTPPPPYNRPAPPPPGVLPDPGELPAGSRMAHSRNKLFVGREDELRQLRVYLLPDGEPATARPTLVTISTGIGGIGKTQLAVEFTHRFGRYFQSVHWLSMGDPAAVEGEIADCGLEMGLYPPGSAVDRPTQLNAVRRAWAGPEPRLLIFDNCEELEVLEKWRPISGGCRVLVTSRNTFWPAELDANQQPITLFPRPQSVALLRQYLDRAGRAETDEALSAVAAEVGDLPLALALAGHYLAYYRHESVTEYLARLEQAADLLPIARKAYSPTGHDLSLWNTFAVSYNKLDTRNPIDGAAMALLARAAYFAPGEPLPEWLLPATMVGPAADATEEEAATVAEHTLAPVAVDAHLLDDALVRLLELGMVERETIAASPVEAGFKPAFTATGMQGGQYLKIHRLIGRFARSVEVKGNINVAEAERKSADRAAVVQALVEAAEQARAAGDLWQIKPWQVHLRYVAESSHDEQTRTTARLYNIFADWLQRGGELVAAMQYTDRALGICANFPSELDEVTAESLNNKGHLLLTKGDFTAARPYFERALAIRERVLGPEDPHVATSLNNLGSLLQVMGDLPAVRPYYERALTISERVLGSEHPDTATSLNNLGSLLKEEGDLPAARPYYERALAIRERALGLEHPDTAQVLNNIGLLLKEMGDLPAARLHLERALAISERALGLEHPDTATSLNNLGLLLHDLGDPAAARLLYARALAIDEKVLGTEHPLTAIDYNNLGFLLQDMGELMAARQHYERALAIRERVLGPEHPDTARSLAGLGLLLTEEGKLDEALTLMRRSLNILNKTLGAAHPDTKKVRNHLQVIEKEASAHRAAIQHRKAAKKEKHKRKKMRR